MKLIDDWRECLNRLWTVRLALLGALLPFADQILAEFQRYIPPWLYSILFLALIFARMWKQKDPEATLPGK